jgi:hypothetical protein
MWMGMATCIRKVASEEFRVTQRRIKEKKECFRRMHLDRSADNVEQYKVVKKTAKRVVSEARGRIYDGLY